MKEYEELLERLRNRKINFDELKELKKLIEDRIRMCEEKEKCDEALSEHIILRIVEELIEKSKHNVTSD